MTIKRTTFFKKIMTQEEKQLLFKDLCGRLPYGIKGEIYLIDNELEKMIGKEHPNPTELHPFNLNLPDEESPFIIKPYLRPMSSMTDKERKAFDNFCVIDEFAWEGNIEIGYKNQANIMSKGIEWLLEHHFDFRGLIEKGLALEAPNDMYKN